MIAGLPPAGRAVAVRRRRAAASSSTRVPRRSRTRSRSRASPPAGRQSIVFDNAFHGRTLLTMTMTGKVKPYKAGFGPFAPEVYRAPSPYPYRGITSTTRSPALEHLFKARRRPGVGRLRRARAGAGRGRLHPDAARLPGAAAGDLPRARDPLRRRRGAVGRRPHRHDVGDRALRRRRARPARLRQVARRRSAARGASRGRPRSMDAVPPGGLGGTFGGNPLVVRRRGGRPRRGRRARVPRAARELGETAARAARGARRAARRRSARCAAWARCWRFELAEQTPDRAQAIVAAAFERASCCWPAASTAT